MAGDLSKSPTALGKGAGYCPAVEDASFLLALQRLWDSPLHLLPFLCSSGRPLISKVGARVWEGFFLVEPPGLLSQLLRSWKSEFGSNTLFSRGVADFPAPVRIGWNAITSCLGKEDLLKLLLTFPYALSPTICPSQLSVGWT